MRSTESWPWLRVCAPAFLDRLSWAPPTGETMLTQAVHLVLLAATVVATPLLAPAGVGRISGHVRDPQGAPIANAAIVILGTQLTTVSDRSGAYKFDSVPEGAYTIRARYIGYTALELHGIRVTAAATTTADFVLQPSSVQLQEVVVDAAAARAAPRAMAKANALYGDAGYRQRHEKWNTEEYGHKDENAFLAVSARPLSTFSIDVDR